ncbi:MAG: hypothetical protein ACRCST_08490 [Turicibacter sp.]
MAIEVVNNNEKLEEQEFTEDLIQTVTVSSYPLKTEKVNGAKNMIQELVGRWL